MLDELSANDSSSGPSWVQLSFPFQVQRVELPRQPNPYSLAPIGDACSEGGGFFYESCPEVFLGRVGYGPLRVAWDTNILIDYAEFGDLIWDEDHDFDPSVSEARYLEELHALNTLVLLSEYRDIRFRAPQRQISDARRMLSDDQWEIRSRQLHHLLAALTCIQLDKDVLENVLPFDPLPDGRTNSDWDYSLVQEAIATGCHVFLTRDDGLCNRLCHNARDEYLAIMSPAGLQQALAEAGDLGWGGRGYIFPDNHKIIHLIRATKRGEE
jgi:hypothetical protein